MKYTEPFTIESRESEAKDEGWFHVSEVVRDAVGQRVVMEADVKPAEGEAPRLLYWMFPGDGGRLYPLPPYGRREDGTPL